MRTEVEDNVVETSKQSYVSELTHYVTDTVSNLYQHGSVKAFLRWTNSSISGVRQYASDSYFATGRVIQKFYNRTEASTNTLTTANQMYSMLLKDVVPVAVVWGAMQFLQSRLDPCYGDLDQSCSFGMSLSMKLVWGMVSTLPFTVSVNRGSNFFLKNSILVSKLPRAMNEETKDLDIRRQSLRDSVAVCEGCSKAQALKHEVWEMANYYLQLLAVGAIDFIPRVGPYAAKVLSVLLHGQFLLGLRLSSDGLCAEHREQYYREYFYLLPAIGLTHEALAQVQLRSMEFLLSRYVGQLSLNAINWQVRMLDSLALIMVLHHIHLPKPVHTSYQVIIDPVYLMRLSGKEFLRLILPGIEKKLKTLLANDGESLSLTDLGRQLSKEYSKLIRYPLSRALIPRTLRSKEVFCTDPVLKEYLELTKELVKILYQIQAYTGLTLATVANDVVNLSFFQAVTHGAIVGANKERKLTPKLLSYFSGFPEEVVSVLTQLLMDVSFTQDLKELIRCLESFGSTMDGFIITGTREALSSYMKTNKAQNLGWYRAYVFRTLFNDYKSVGSVKYFLCLSIALNEDSTKLRSHVIKQIEAGINNKGFFNKHGEEVLHRFSEQMIEQMELEISGSTGELDLALTTKLINSAKLLAATINEELKNTRNQTDSLQAIERIKTEIKQWREESYQKIRSAKEAKSKGVKGKLFQLLGTNIVPNKRQVDVSIVRESVDKSTEIKSITLKVYRGLNTYLKTPNQGTKGMARANYYKQAFKEIDKKAQSINKKEKSQFKLAVVAAATIGDPNGQFLRQALATQLSCSVSDLLGRQDEFIRLLARSILESDENKLMIFSVTLKTLCSSINLAANKTNSKSLQEVLIEVDNFVEHYLSDEENKQEEENGKKTIKPMVRS